MSRTILAAVAATAVFAGAHLASAADNNSGRYQGGADIGPFGQCFSRPDCGRGEATNGYRARGAYGSCPIIRERVVTDSGRVIYRRHRAC